MPETLLEHIASRKDTIAAIVGLLTIVTTVYKLWPWLQQYWRKGRDRKYLTAKLGAEAYTASEILRATANYVEPDCQDIDPSGLEDFRRVHAARQHAFELFDRILLEDTRFRHTILLADSGMGKTSFLLNLYARIARADHVGLRIDLVPLGHSRADELIKAVPDKPKTILLLDAFDEDTLAIVDHRTRLSDLLQLCNECRHVVIACRTQFFYSDEEIPRQSGVLRFGPTGPGESKEYLINKVYLSPFSDKQVRDYLRRRFPIWKYNRRREAARICDQVADLAARPMLLAHIQDLQAKRARIRNISDIYEELLQAWVERERAFVDGEALIRFSEELAVDIHHNRIARGTETIPFAALQPLAANFGIRLEEWQLSGRSLLNRTSDGSRKFAHRSIMEFLVIRRFLKAPETVGRTQWTDQMKRFFWEMVAHSAARGVPLSPSLSLADMSGFHRAPEWQPNLSLGSCPPLVEGTFESIGGPARPRGLYVLDYVSGIVYLWPAIIHSFDWQDLPQTPVTIHRDSLQSLWSAAGSTVQAFGIEVREWNIVRTEHLPTIKPILDLLPPEITAAVDLEFTIWSQWPGSRS